jgi:hypothetical protein
MLYYALGNDEFRGGGVLFFGRIKKEKYGKVNDSQGSQRMVTGEHKNDL